MNTDDTRSIIFSYLDESYIYLAPVCTSFLGYWKDKPKSTRAITKSTTVNQLEDAFRSGLCKTERIAISCSSIGRLDLVICAFSHGCKTKYNYLPYEVCEEACRNGHIDIVKWYIDETKHLEFRMDVKACALSAEKGYIDIVKLFDYRDTSRSSRNTRLKRYRVYCNYDVSSAAASHGHLVLLKWLVENHCSFRPGDWGVMSDGHRQILHEHRLRREDSYRRQRERRVERERLKI